MNFSFLILIPIFLLALTAFTLLIIRWFMPSFRFSWLIAASGALFSWACQLWLYHRIPTNLILMAWEPLEVFRSSPAVTLDRVSWPFAMALSTLSLAVILSATARKLQNNDIAAWSGILLITAAGTLSLLSANLISLLLTWTVIDLVEMAVLLVTAKGKAATNAAVLTFSVRVAGTILVLFAAIQSPAAWSSFDFFAAPAQSGLFFLVGIALRVGLLPFHTPYPDEIPMRRGVGTVLRLVTPATCLVALARMPSGLVSEQTATVLLAVTALAAFYSALSWLTAEDELAGRPYWITALAALAITCVVRGYPNGALVWGLTLILSGGCLFLFSARSIRVAYLPILGLWGLTGLPFSPSAGGWQGLVSGPASLLNVIFIAAHILLLMGYARHAIRAGEPFNEMEQWVKLLYPLGLLLLVGTQLALGWAGWEGSRTAGVWWAGVVSLVVAGLMGFGYYRFDNGQISGPTAVPQTWWGALIVRIYRYLTRILSLSWLYTLLAGLYRFIGRLVSFFTTILEGDGGVLWAIVLLLLLLTLLHSGGAA